MRKNTTIKYLATIIVFLFIGTSFISISASIIVDNQNKSIISNGQRNGLENNLFDLKMSFFMKLAKFPSLSACIIDDDEVIWSKGYGYYDLKNKKPATENTIYMLASITKPVTGTALMQLCEQGLFDLDEDVNNYLPLNLNINLHQIKKPTRKRMGFIK